MTRKVKTVIFDGDLKAEIKTHPVSASGDRIDVKKGGEAHFMPRFDKGSFLDMPYRSLSSPWKISYKRTYFVRRLSKKCVNFETETLEGPSPEEVKTAAGATMLKDIGKSKQETSTVQWVTLAVVIFILLNVLGVV